MRGRGRRQRSVVPGPGALYRGLQESSCDRQRRALTGGLPGEAGDGQSQGWAVGARGFPRAHLRDGWRQGAPQPPPQLEGTGRKGSRGIVKRYLVLLRVVVLRSCFFNSTETRLTLALRCRSSTSFSICLKCPCLVC